VTGSLNTGRELQTMTLLADGKVLVTGGDVGPFTSIASAELYDPDTGRWSATGSLTVDRTEHTASLLPDGRVMVTAGFSVSLHAYLASAELYDPATGTWSATGSLNQARDDHAATLLANGKVLATGGVNSSGALASAELYDAGSMLPTQVSGRGSIDGQGDQANFIVRASQSGGQPSGSLSFSDHAAGVSFAKAGIRTLTFDGNSANLSGRVGLSDGTRVTYKVTVTDNSSDGSSDSFTIRLSNGYSAGGTLTKGDIQVQ